MDESIENGIDKGGERGGGFDKELGHSPIDFRFQLQISIAIELFHGEGND